MFTKDDIQHLYYNPHKIGWLMGKTKLTSQHSKWIKYIWDAKGSEPRSLMAHRGSYKTTAVAAVGSVRWLLMHPDQRIAIIRKTFTDAADVTKTISLSMDMPELQQLFFDAHGMVPKKVRDKDGFILFSFKKTFTPEPSIRAHGLDYGLTGKHYDFVLMDDIITLKDRISPSEREKTKEIFREITTNILDPGLLYGVMGTPWHKRDAWSICPEPWKIDVLQAGILSPEEIEKKKRSTTPVLYAANYLLVHQSDDMALFKDPAFNVWDWAIEPVMQLDAAFDGDHYCALTIIGKRTSGKYQGIGWIYPGNVKDWVEFIVEKYRRYKCRRIWIETNADKGYTADTLRGKGLNARDYAERENKHLKIASHLYLHWNEIEWDPSMEDSEFLAQILDYREGQEPDDAPDSAGSLMRQEFDPKKDTNAALWKM